MTVRESRLLWDPEINSVAEKRNVVLTIAHGFAEQWLGNLVTKKFWSHLWLTDGFANLFQYIGTDLVSGFFRLLTIFDAKNELCFRFSTY